jgi:flagellar hook-basal body complex protein FliE
MPDPLGIIGTAAVPRPSVGGPPPQAGAAGGPKFKEALDREIERVNELQRDATEAIEDLAAGRRDDLEGVLAATQKADIAFRLLLQVRNKLLEAYEEVKQIRI